MHYHFFFFNDTATTEIYTLSLHDALPILALRLDHLQQREEHWAIVDLVGKGGHVRTVPMPDWVRNELNDRSEEHTSELQSRLHLVCRLLLEKKKRISGSHTARTDLSDSAC